MCGRSRARGSRGAGGALSCALWGLWRRADRCCLMPRLSPVRCGCGRAALCALSVPRPRGRDAERTRERTAAAARRTAHAFLLVSSSQNFPYHL